MGNFTINCGNADAQSHDKLSSQQLCWRASQTRSEAETPIPNSANTDGDADPAYIALLLSTLSLYLLDVHFHVWPRLYSEACRTQQFIPPRYEHYFPRGTSCLFDINFAECSLQNVPYSLKYWKYFVLLLIASATIRISTEFSISSIATESLKLHSHCYNDQALVAI